jgi:hypothetical protein
MRSIAVILMFGLTLAVSFLPTPDRLEPGPEPARVIPPVSVCPIFEVGERRTSVSVLSSVNGPGRLSMFSAGEATRVLDFRTGRTGSVTIPASDVAAVGVAGGLIEMPSDTTASGVVIAGGGSRAAESCADIPSGQAFIAGGSTASGAAFDVQLVNPYAGEAVVDLTVTTDAGIESDERFDAVIVPALSSITLDLTQIIGGRDSISVNIETSRGSVLAFGRQTTDQRTAVWRAVAPGQDWWLPVPEGGDTKELVIGSPTNAEIEYQVDLYGPAGVVESFASGTIGPRGMAVLSLTTETTEAVGVRVITTGPVVSSLWIDSAAGFASTTGSQVDAPVWFLPGASLPVGGVGSVVVLNTGIESVTVAFRSLNQAPLTRSLPLSPEGLLVVPLVQADGYRIEATGPVVALWTSQLEGAGTAAMGIPVQDG